MTCGYYRIKAALRVLMALGLCVFSKPLFGSNFHEHYSTLANYEDYVLAFRSVNMPLERVVFKKLSENPQLAISHIFGHDVATRLFASGDVSALTFGEVAGRLSKLLGASTADVMRACFESSRLGKRNRMAIETIGWDIRSNAQNILAETSIGIHNLFKNYLQRTPPLERKVLSISISARHFFDPKLRLTIEQLKSQFRANGTTPEYFLVFQRTRLIEFSDAEFEHFIAQFRETAKADLVDGFDLVGSLHEAAIHQMDLSNDLRVRLKQRLFRIFKLLNESEYSHLHFKIHAWETPHLERVQRRPAEGDFYKVLWETLSDISEGRSAAKLPTVFRIGHISGLDSADVARFVELRKKTGVQFIFEANIESNTGTHAVTIADLGDMLTRLDSAGFTVVMGTDGEGIFGRGARFTRAYEALLNSGVSREVLERIRSRSSTRLNCSAKLL